MAKWGSVGEGDGQFAYPFDITVDSLDNVYVADTQNDRIQKFSSTGTFLTKWGSAGSNDGQFSYPQGITIDTNGNVYVSDSSNNRIQKFSSTGTFLTKWGGYSGDGQFYFPTGVAVDSSDNIYVADYCNHRIQKFSSNGAFLGKWGSYGTRDGQFNRPNGITIDPSGNVYVLNSWDPRIQKFGSTGNFLAKWGSEGSGDGQFTYPQDVAIDSECNVYVADTSNDRIQKFSSTGAFLGKWGSYGTEDGQFKYPGGVATDSSGNIYVIDSSNNRIQKFSSNGIFLGKWGSWGSSDGQFDYPKGIAVDSAGNIYVTDSSNNRIQKFSSNGIFLGKWGSLGSSDGQFNYPEGIAVDSSGNIYVSDGNHRIQKFSPPAIITPVANFTCAPTTGAAPLTVLFTDTSRNSPTVWDWTFGDGGSSSLQNPTHTYSTAGTYTVSLTAINASSSNTLTRQDFITVTYTEIVPVANFIGTPTTGTAPLTVSFTDCSTNYPTSWNWSFGDGSSSILQNPNHTYSNAGTYTVSLSATNSAGSTTKTMTHYITVSAGVIIPVANFTCAPTTGTAPLTVSFTDCSTNYPTSWNWSFGDGSSSNLQNPNHTYSNAGTYTVSLSATNSAGSNSSTRTNYILVTSSGTTPVANFTANVTRGNIPFSVRFTDESYGNPTNWSWDFGDGSISTVQNPVHTYLNAGTYTVSLNVTNAYGSTVKTRTNYISVIQESLSLMEVLDNPTLNYTTYGSSSWYGQNKIWYYGGSAARSGTVGDSQNTAMETFVQGPVNLSFFWNVSSERSYDFLQFYLDGVMIDKISGEQLSWVQKAYSLGSGNHSVRWVYTKDSTQSHGSDCGWVDRIATPSPSPVAPVANFTGAPTSGTAPLTVSFTDRSTNYPTAWNWSFGDGSSSNLQNPNHTYSNAGTYTVSLSATNSAGSTTKTMTHYIAVSPGVITPVVIFTGTPTSGSAPLTVTFTDRSINSPTSWNWSFGDGNVSSLQNPVHTYVRSGAYSVSLNATNATGSNAITLTNYIFVTGSKPTADFSADVSYSRTAPLTVSFTDLSQNYPSGWAWFFGDENFTAPWTLMNASSGWSAREGHTSVVLPDGSIVLMGGIDNSNRKNDTWRSTDSGLKWTLMNASSGWSPRYGHTSVVLPDGSIVLMGGYGGGNDVWRSTDSGATWGLVNASAGWSPRDGHTSVVLPDGSIVLMGGDDTSSKNDVWRSTDNGATWALVNANPGWGVRGGHSSVVMGDGSIVTMGRHSGSMNDVWRSSDKGVTWTQINASAGWKGRGHHTSVVMPDDSIVLMGGYASGAKNDVWRSTDKGVTWTQMSASAKWNARYSHTSVVLPDGSIVLMGGRDDGVTRQMNDTWRFVPTGATVQNPSHTYTTPGVYPVSLQSFNNGGYNQIRKEGYIRIGIQVPNFTGIPTSGVIPFIVTFNDISSGPRTSWNWSFGDGTFSSFQNPVHNYTIAGTYTVSLNISIVEVSNITVKENYIIAKEPELEPSFGVNRTDGFVPFPVRFSDTSKGINAAWNWSFGDGTTSTEQNPVHTYLSSGIYTVHLSVTNTTTTKQIMKTGLITVSDSNVVFWNKNTVLSGNDARYPFAGIYLFNNLTISDDVEVTSKGISQLVIQVNGTLKMGKNAVIRVRNGYYPEAPLRRISSLNSLTDLNHIGIDMGTYRLYDSLYGRGGNGGSGGNGGHGLVKKVYGTWLAGDGGWGGGGGGGGFGGGKGGFGGTYGVPAHYGTQFGDLGHLGNNGLDNGGDGGAYREHDYDPDSGGGGNGGLGNNIGGGGYDASVAPVSGTGGGGNGGSGGDGGYDSYGLGSGGGGGGGGGGGYGGGILTIIADTISLDDTTGTSPSFLVSGQTGGLRGLGGGNSGTSGADGEGGLLIINATHYNYSSWHTNLDTSISYPVGISSQNGGHGIVTGNPQRVFVNFIDMNSPPNGFAANITDGKIPLTVQFTDLSRNNPISWNWSFGDGHVSGLQNPVHTYTTPGTFTVRLTVTNATTSNVTEKINYITGHASAPMTNFTSNVTSGTVPLSVKFFDTSLNDPTGWSWYFGDETFSQSWIQMNASAGFQPRMYSSSVALPDGSIVLMGGRDYFYLLNDVWRSTDNGVTWQRMNEKAEWSERIGQSSVVLSDGSILLMGGGSGGDYKNDVWRSTDNGITWDLVTLHAGWSGREWATTVVMADDSIVLMGGESSFPNYENDVWRSTDRGKTWIQINASAGWTARKLHSSVVMPDGSIVLIGGLDSYSYKNDVWRSTNNGSIWTQVNKNANWPTGGSHSVVVPDGSILQITGGTNITWRSTDYGATWTQLNSTQGFIGRDGQNLIVTPDGGVVLLGGCDYGEDIYMNDVWRLSSSGSSEQNPTHIYTSPGNYSIAMQAFNNGGFSPMLKTGYISVTSPQAPIANFIANQTSGTVPVTIKFNDISTGIPTSWNWSFGDGSFTIEQNPIHTYMATGNYTVSLNATNDRGSNMTTRTNYISVTNPTPVAGFTGIPTTGTVPLIVRFTDSSTNTPTSWNWNFGDGSTINTTVQNPVHTYAAAGIYTVSLNVTNAAGSNMTTRTGYITVTPPTPPLWNMSLTYGWNLVSIPFTNAQYVVPANAIDTIYSYNVTTMRYNQVPLSSLEPGKAYWVASTRDCIVNVTGQPEQPLVKDLKTGWNLIGSTDSSVPFSSITVDPAGSWSLGFVYGYNVKTKMYEQVTSLQSGKGYWGAVNRDCTITIPELI
ncbi:MAG: PKD domain-containing protein [Methanoregula sp.]